MTADTTATITNVATVVPRSLTDTPGTTSNASSTRTSCTTMPSTSAATAPIRPASTRNTGRTSASAAASTPATKNAVHHGEISSPDSIHEATNRATPVGMRPISASRTSRPVACSADARGLLTAAFCRPDRR